MLKDDPMPTRHEAEFWANKTVPLGPLEYQMQRFARAYLALLALPVAETGWQWEKAKLEMRIGELAARLDECRKRPKIGESMGLLGNLAVYPAPPEPPEGEAK